MADEAKVLGMPRKMAIPAIVVGAGLVIILLLRRKPEAGAIPLPPIEVPVGGGGGGGYAPAVYDEYSSAAERLQVEREAFELEAARREEEERRLSAGLEFTARQEQLAREKQFAAGVLPYEIGTAQAELERERQLATLRVGRRGARPGEAYYDPASGGYATKEKEHLSVFQRAWRGVEAGAEPLAYYATQYYGRQAIGGLQLPTRRRASVPSYAALPQLEPLPGLTFGPSYGGVG